LPGAAFKRIGHINCPTTPVPVGSSLPTPFSMAVDHKGTAFVVFSDGELFRVSTVTAQCAATSYVPIPDMKPFHTFGMGFSENTVGTGEALFIASDNFNDAGVPSELGMIDTTTLKLSALAAFPPNVQNAELTGTGGGDLFAFFSQNTSLDYQLAPSWIGRIDKQTAKVTNSFSMPTLAQGCGWAFSFWGGDFYMFTAPLPTMPGVMPTCPSSTQPQPQTVVTRFRPSDSTTTVVVPLFGEEIVGAGVSTCAPQQ
jgi:hypothetical protein